VLLYDVVVWHSQDMQLTLAKLLLTLHLSKMLRKRKK
jgi:hypothetical protein